MSAPTLPTAPPSPPVTAPRRPPFWRRHKIFTALAVVVAFIVVIVIATSGSTGTTKSSTKSQSPASSAPSSQPSSNISQGNAAPKYTLAQQNAIQSAQSYLDMGTGFSRAGLIRQLSSKAGGGFAMADAVFAVNHVKVNWNEQAILAANGYLDMGTGFSRAGLIRQLTSNAGSQFTLAQATYAVNHVKVNWNEQAVLAAKAYLDVGIGFSRAGLIRQLTSNAGSQFTLAQATYAVNHLGLR